MIPLLNALLLVSLLAITYQDITERKVFTFLFPLAALLFGILHYLQASSPTFFWVSVGVNLVIVTLIVLLLALYARLKMRRGFLNESIGLGDLSMLYALCFAFTPMPFLIILVGGLFFSLAMHFLLKKHSAFKTVPLAGYLAAFLALTYVANWIGWVDNLYF